MMNIDKVTLSSESRHAGEQFRLQERQMLVKRTEERATDTAFLDTLVDTLLSSGVHDLEERGSRTFARLGSHVGEVSRERMASGIRALLRMDTPVAFNHREAVLWDEDDRVSSACAAFVWLASFTRTPSAVKELG
jgi:hypothetical protein